MRTLAILIAAIIAATPTMASAQRRGGGGMSRPAPPPRASAPNQGRGFNLRNDVPSTRPATPNVNNRMGNVNRSGNTGNINRSGNTGNINRSGNTASINRSGNTANINRSGNTVNVNRYQYNNFGYRGAVVVNPIYRGPAWGWNRGVIWAPVGAYWGGGFWGGFATAALMGSIYYSNHRYTSYQVSSGSPGATLLSNYGLQQVQCGPPNLVVVYGPNNGVICANPNGRVAAGNYVVNVDSLTLQSQ